MDVQEIRILERLDRALGLPAVRAVIDPIADDLALALDQDAAPVMAWQAIPLRTYGSALAGDICSSWVFVLRRGVSTGPERHPNSRQRMMSYRAGGNLPTKTELEHAWSTNHLQSDRSAPLLERWISVPPNVWHQAEVGAEHWVVVSFQTAAETELVEERPDPRHPGRFVRKRYAAGP